VVKQFKNNNPRRGGNVRKRYKLSNLSRSPIARSVKCVQLRCVDPDDMLAFWLSMGFEENITNHIDKRKDISVVGIPNCNRGIVCICSLGTEKKAPSVDKYKYEIITLKPGRIGIDLYTRDLEESTRIISKYGYDVSSVESYNIGDRRTNEARIIGPEGQEIFLMETSARRKSWLDMDPRRLHSEIQNIVLLYPDADSYAEELADRINYTRVGTWKVDNVMLQRMLDADDVETDPSLVMYAACDNDPIRIGAISLKKEIRHGYVSLAPEIGLVVSSINGGK